MPWEGASPTKGVVSTPVEVVLRGLEGRLGCVRSAFSGAVTRRVLIKTFFWKPNKISLNCLSPQQMASAHNDASCTLCHSVKSVTILQH